MADVKPWKVMAAGGGLGELREFADGDAVPISAGGTGSNNEAGARTALGLGSGATATLQTSLTDQTPGRAALVGSGGWLLGNGANPPSLTDWQANDLATGLYYLGAAATSKPPMFAAAAGLLLAMKEWAGNMGSSGSHMHLAFDRAGKIAYSVRNNNAAPTWLEILTTGLLASIPVSTSLSPSTDNNRSCGSASGRWSVVYAGTGTINTSDAREKTEVRALTAAEVAAAQALAAEIGAYQFLAAVAEKGAEAARQHIGMTVQRAIEVMEAHGLDPFGYGFICYDAWPDQVQEHPAEYEQIEVVDPETDEVVGYEQGELIREAWSEVTLPAGDRFSFRMDELLAFVARGQAARLDAMEARLAALESLGPGA